tara:strand:+ start:522 stop:728 length:207 start_codon:yes stop_codon:yes gene_type:complete
MLYLEIPDRIGSLQILLKGGHYTLADLVDLILEHADGSEDTTEDSSCSDDDFETREFQTRLFGTSLSD